MKIDYSKLYFKDIKLLDKKTLQKVIAVIDAAKLAKNFPEIANIKKMHGKGCFYRIRIGNHRIGVEIINDKIIFHRILPRKDIYKYFP